MIKYKSEENYYNVLKRGSYIFSIKDYTYIFTKQEWDEIPIVNNQPSFNVVSQYLQIETFEEDGVVKRRWIVTDVPPEIQDE